MSTSLALLFFVPELRTCGHSGEYYTWISNSQTGKYAHCDSALHLNNAKVIDLVDY